MPFVTVLLPVYWSLIPHPLQTTRSHRALPACPHTHPAPEAGSSADPCPGAQQSLSLACIQHSHLFNYFCSVSLIFLSLWGAKQAADPSPARDELWAHPRNIFTPVPRQK